MRIFRDKKGGWGDKVNFVDKNNVLVGYDMDQHCCERADWFISDKEMNRLLTGEGHGIVFGLEEYIFDRDYFVQVELEKDEWGHTCLDAGDMVRFKLVAPSKRALYLHIYNSHNGYYGHGFTAEINGQSWQQGTL